jgi:aspartate aminotransferase
MLELLNTPKGDPILSIMSVFRADERPEKIDLGIGVYKDENGQTPIMQAVRSAEIRLANNATTKSYMGLVGDESFNKAIQALVLGNTQAQTRAATLQTPGASGALSTLADLIKLARPDARVWIGNPSYINHRPIMQKAGLEVMEYPYLDLKTKKVNEEAMLKAIAALGPKDVLLLHGCCHNPSGADLSMKAWEEITLLAQKNGFLPFVDIAYQGLGDGMDEDAAGLRFLVDRVDEALVSTSCSKNFGLYRERIGAAIVVAKTLQKAKETRMHMGELARGTYSMPPAHGAAIVAEILNDAALKSQWNSELEAMRKRVVHLRKKLVETFRKKTNSDRFDYIGSHKGMFSMTGLSNEQIAKLQKEHAIYVVPGGRVNIAGLRESQIEAFVSAFVDVGA